MPHWPMVPAVAGALLREQTRLPSEAAMATTPPGRELQALRAAPPAPGVAAQPWPQQAPRSSAQPLQSPEDRHAAP